MTAADGAAQAPRFPVLPADAAAHTGMRAPCEIPGLEGRATCGVFRVPEAQGSGSPAGPTLDIAFIVIAARDSAARQADAVVYLPGGPGEAVLQSAETRARGLGALLADRDLLLIDPRGVGRSAPLRCDVSFPRGLPSRFGALFALDHIAACRDALARGAALDQYTSAAVVADIESLRRWLGYPRVNLIGHSYGTRLAQHYMRSHPASIRTVTMNGVAPLDELMYLKGARYLQRALELMIAECQAADPCRSANPRLRTQVPDLLASLASAPARLVVRGETIEFGAGDLAYTLRGMLYGRASEIPPLIQRAAGGDLLPLVEAYLARTEWIGGTNGYAGLHLSTLCAEDIAPVRDAEVRLWTAGTFAGDHIIQGYRAACALWPYARLAPGYRAPVRSDIPTLLLSGENDPVTPPEGAARVASALTRSRHVVVEGAGHVVRGPCPQALIEAFIRDLTLPAEGSGCAAPRPGAAAASPAITAAPGPPRVNEGYPRLSPDGRWLLFVSDRVGNYDLYLREIGTGATRALTRSPALDYSPRWSPDARRVVFSSDRTGGSDIWELELATGVERNITMSPEDEHEPDYTPDGAAIVFARTVRAESRTEGERRVIVRRSLANAGESVLTTGDGVESYPSIAPDGRSLLFRRARAGEESEVWIRDLGSGRERNLSRHRSRDDYPAWSPDGRHVVFASDRASGRRNAFDLFAVEAGGGGLRRLTTVSEAIRFHHRPAFDPSGRRMLANRRVGDRLEAISIPFDPDARAAAAPDSPVTTLTPSDAAPSRERLEVRQWRRDNASTILAELTELLAMPNLATDSVAIRANADWLVGRLRSRGFESRLLEVAGGAPAVLGEMRVPGATRTVTLYAHFDGQPAAPGEWRTAGPWAPELRSGRVEEGAPAHTAAEAGAAGTASDDWRLYARSASDDKGPIVALLAALDAIRARGFPLRVNLKVLLEGEEEQGSPRLRELLTAHRDALRTDAWLFLDGPMDPSGAPVLFHGVRGALPLRLTLFGPGRELHSGHYGNWAPNPALRLSHLLASMRAPDGRVTINGFADGVVGVTSADSAAVRALPARDGALAAELAFGDPEGGPLGLAVLHPALNVVALRAGTGANVVPSEATATTDLRLVQGQDVARVKESVEAHLRGQGYEIAHDRSGLTPDRPRDRVALVEWGRGYAGQRTALTDPFARELAGILEREHGEQVLRVPSAGGSLPLSVFAEVIGGPIVTLPIVNADNSQHAANENLRLGNLWRGIEILAVLLTSLGAADR